MLFYEYVNQNQTHTWIAICISSATSHSDVQFIESLWTMHHYVMRPTNFNDWYVCKSQILSFPEYVLFCNDFFVWFFINAFRLILPFSAFFTLGKIWRHLYFWLQISFLHKISPLKIHLFETNLINFLLLSIFPKKCNSDLECTPNETKHQTKFFIHP